MFDGEVYVVSGAGPKKFDDVNAHTMQHIPENAHARFMREAASRAPAETQGRPDAPWCETVRYTYSM